MASQASPIIERSNTFAIIMTSERVETIPAPAVPLTIEGSSVLHQMLRVRWSDWKKLPADSQQSMTQEAVETLARLEADGQSALYSLLGHKADLMLIHFRASFEELDRIKWELARLRLWDYLEPAHSYVSMVELGLYESTSKAYQTLADRGVAPYSPEWDQAIEEILQRQREAMATRLFPKVPESRYLCFYPMDRKRGEGVNWYTVPMADRQRLMHEHGMVGRRYAGAVKQIISGSIGFDDWEWGVDLWSDDALQFKKLIYEMRFDEVSAVYALFGAFYLGVRLRPQELAGALRGEAR
jgi:chlorite dismutase